MNSFASISSASISDRAHLFRNAPANNVGAAEFHEIRFGCSAPRHQGIADERPVPAILSSGEPH